MSGNDIHVLLYFNKDAKKRCYKLLTSNKVAIIMLDNETKVEGMRDIVI